MSKKYNVAVIGATGNVGRETLSILKERNFPIDQIYAVASKSSLGKEVSFGETDILKTQTIENLDFKNIDLAFLAAGHAVSQEYGEKIAAQGCMVIDDSSYFRMNSNVPLIVPEVNAQDLIGHKNIIANPNCSVIPLVMALNPLHDEAGIKRVVISTYQSVSGAGRRAMDELFRQTKATFISQEVENVEFPKRIAFNIIPHIDEFMSSGYTKEEWKMEVETKKILDDNIEVTATCVRVPVFVGHCASLNIELSEDIDLKQVRKLLSKSPGIFVVDRHSNGGYATPIDVVRDDGVFVSRIRKDNTIKHGLNLWVATDNLRKGAALNAVQIAELLINK